MCPYTSTLLKLLSINPLATEKHTFVLLSSTLDVSQIVDLKDIVYHRSPCNKKHHYSNKQRFVSFVAKSQELELQHVFCSSSGQLASICQHRVVKIIDFCLDWLASQWESNEAKAGASFAKNLLQTPKFKQRENYATILGSLFHHSHTLEHVGSQIIMRSESATVKSAILSLLSSLHGLTRFSSNFWPYKSRQRMEADSCLNLIPAFFFNAA